MPVRTAFSALGFSWSHASRSGTVVAGARTIAPVDSSMKTMNRILRSPKRARSCRRARASVTRALLSAIVSPMPSSSSSLMAMAWLLSGIIPPPHSLSTPPNRPGPSSYVPIATGLLGPSPPGDLPDRLHRAPAHRVDAVVEVDGGVAVRREELDELPELGQPLRLGGHEPPVLVASPGILHARPLHRLGHEGPVRREGLEAAVHHRHLLARHAHHRGQHGERHLELVVGRPARAADAPVVEVHHAVGAGLQLGHPLELAVDVEGAARAAGHDVHRHAVLLEELA